MASEERIKKDWYSEAPAKKPLDAEIIKQPTFNIKVNVETVGSKVFEKVKEC